MAIENRGFASMSVERRKEIASLGGKASRGGGRKRKVRDDQHAAHHNHLPLNEED